MSASGASAEIKGDYERIKLALRCSKTVVWDWNLQTGHLYMADEAHQILGQRDELQDKHSVLDWITCVHPDDVIPVSKAMIAHWKGELPDMDQTFRIFDSEGHIRWVRSRGLVTHRDANGRATRVTGTHTDVTADRRMLEERRAQVDLLDQMVDIVPSAVWITDISGAIWKLNRAFESLVEMPRGALLGRKLSDVFPHASSAWAEQQDRLLIEQPGEQTYELSINLADGRTKTLEVRKATLVMRDGTVTALVGTAQDIGERKSEQLAVRGAKQAIEAAGESQAAYFDGLGHQMRTPMNGIIGMIELAMDSELSVSQREQLTQARESASGLLTLFDDLSGLARAQSTQSLIEPEYFDLRLELSKLLRMMRPGAVRKELTLSGAIDEAVPEKLIGDVKRLRQVLVNLISNAIKFTRRGNIALRVSLDEINESYPPGAALGGGIGIRLRFSISDTGVGIAPTLLPLLWTPDGDTDTSLNIGGLGLRVARHLVSVMGGALDVRSELGRGTEVVMTIPFGLVSPQTANESMPVSPVVADAESGDDLWPHRQTTTHVEPAKPLRVLVVEDTLINQALLVALLKRMGHTVLPVGDGQSAVDAYRRQSFDLVLMDVQLPIMDGLEATKQIRLIQNQSEWRVPIVGVTAHALVSDREACLDAGMDDVLIKPIDRNRLARLLVDVAGLSINPTHSPEEG